MFTPSYREIKSVNYVNGPVVIVSGGQRIKTSLYDVDLLGKVTVPFGQFFAFGDAGAAYVHEKTKAVNVSYVGQFVPNAPVPSVFSVFNAVNKGYIRPEMGAGLGYNLTQNLALTVSYQRIFGKGKVNQENFIPNLNTTALGIVYKF